MFGVLQQTGLAHRSMRQAALRCCTLLLWVLHCNELACSFETVLAQTGFCVSFLVFVQLCICTAGASVSPGSQIRLANLGNGRDARCTFLRAKRDWYILEMLFDVGAECAVRCTPSSAGDSPRILLCSVPKHRKRFLQPSKEQQRQGASCAARQDRIRW